MLIRYSVFFPFISAIFRSIKHMTSYCNVVKFCNYFQHTDFSKPVVFSVTVFIRVNINYLTQLLLLSIFFILIDVYFYRLVF